MNAWNKSLSLKTMSDRMNLKFVNTNLFKSEQGVKKGSISMKIVPKLCIECYISLEIMIHPLTHQAQMNEWN